MVRTDRHVVLICPRIWKPMTVCGSVEAAWGLLMGELLSSGTHYEFLRGEGSAQGCETPTSESHADHTRVMLEYWKL